METRALQSFLVPRPTRGPSLTNELTTEQGGIFFIYLGNFAFDSASSFLKKREKKRRKVRKNGLRFSSMEIDILPPFDYERSFPIFNSRRILGPDRRARLEEGNDRAKKNQRATGAVEAGG